MVLSFVMMVFFWGGLHSSKQQILKIVLQQNMPVHKMSIITIKCRICTDAPALCLHSKVSMETAWVFTWLATAECSLCLRGL